MPNDLLTGTAPTYDALPNPPPNSVRADRAVAAFGDEFRPRFVEGHKRFSLKINRHSESSMGLERVV